MAARHTSYEPLPRSGHAAVVVDNKLHMWGGWTGSEEKSQDLRQQIDILTEQWEQKATHGNPPGLYLMAYTVVGSFLFVVGGWDGESRYNRVFNLDLHTCQWEEVQVSNPSRGPQRKTGCGMVSYGDNQLVVFAGYTDSGYTDELHVFDLNKGEWSSPAVTGTKPPPHSILSFTKVDSSRAVVYGGWTGGAENADAYVLDLDKWHWTKLDTTGGPRPCARFYHAACCIAGPLTGQEHPLLLVEGGYNCNGGVLKDMWMLDVDRGVWSEVTLPQEMGPRCRHTATVLWFGPNFRMVVMFGGERKDLGIPIAETTFLHLECYGGGWQVTRIVTKSEQGRPVERLREQMENLQTTDANQRMREAEATAQESTQAVEQAEQRVTQAEQRATQAEQRVTQAEQRATQAEQRAAQAEQRAVQSDQRATQAEAVAHFLQQQNEEMVVRVGQAEQTAREVQERARMTEQRAQRLEMIGHYQFWVVNREEIQLTDQELGRGGWAVVRVAKFRGLQVAAKCLHNVIVSDYNRQLFVREMSIAARVRHPNLVQFIGAMVEGEPIILTELMATSLRAVLERRPFNPAQTTSISLDVARALNYLHLMHPDPIIHRDISSANVLLEPGPSNSWKAKVSDYGSANFLQQLRTADPGNPTYAAPEADIPSQQSPKMDVYSYGVLLLEMCSQRFPNPEECEALLQRVQQPAMVALIRHCMEREPMRRPTMSDITGQLE